MSRLTKRKLKVIRGLALPLVFLLIGGCATAPPPYVFETKVLPPAQFSSQYSPTVRVRPASSEEAENITQFSGKKHQESLTRINISGDSIGDAILTPVCVLFFWPDIIPQVVSKYKAQHKEKLLIKKTLEEFPSRLREGIEQRFSVPSSGESSDLLEVVYFTGSSLIDNKECFVVHAQVTLKSKGEEVCQDIIRIDPRACNADVQQPGCSRSPDKILIYADEIIPKMIETRLPGLPWKAKRLRENDEPLLFFR